MTTWIRAYVNPALVSPAAFGDDVYPATAGGYVVAGPTGVSPYNAWIGKVAAPGQLQWQKKVGCGASNVLSVQQTSDGGYILAGGSNGCASQCASGGLSYLAGAWVLKLSPAGAVDWQNVYPAALQSSASRVRQTSDGGYVVAGSTQDSSGANYAWIAKLSSQGAVQWQRQIGASTFADAQTVQQTSDGRYIIAGSTGSIGSSSVLVVKLDASGTIQWQQTSSTGSDYEDTASSVPQTADDGYVVAGQVIPQIPPGIRLPDALLLKLTSGGTIQWQDRYDAGDSLSSSVLRTADGGYAIAGSIQLIVDGEPETASWLAKTTFTGTISWQHDYYAINASTTRPYPRAFSGLAQAGDGGFVAARYTDGYRNSDNVWLVKTDATGNVASCAEARPRHVRGRRRRADGVRVVTSRRGTGYCRSRSQRRHRHHGYSHHPQGLLSDASRAGHHTRNGADGHRHGHAVRQVLAGDVSYVAGRGHDRYTRNPRKDHRRTLPIRARPASAGGRWGMPITASKGHCHDEHAK